MPLDSYLPPDSPLHRPITFRRLTSDDRYNEIEAAAPKHSLMTQGEADALLTEAGTVWFICQATELNHFEASCLYLAGKPWPLREVGDEGQWAEGILTPKQQEHLASLFQPVANQELILYDLWAECWLADNQPKDGSVWQVRAYWEHIASETHETVEMVKRVAIALYVYYCCLQNFAKQRLFDKMQ